MRMTIELTLDEVFRLAADHPTIRAKFAPDAELTFTEGEMLQHHGVRDLPRDNYLFGITVYDPECDEDVAAGSKHSGTRKRMRGSGVNGA